MTSATTATATEHYAGFWARVLACLIDVVLLSAITVPLMMSIYGRDYWQSTALVRGPADVIVSWVLPAIAVIVLWATWQSTPGKMALRMRIVDATTGENPTPRQCTLRYFAYLASLLPLALGFAWVAWDPRKQAWHDKLANTVVVRR